MKKAENKLFKALNAMWREDMMNCCKLPCTDKICRADMDEEGGCKGAEFADQLNEELKNTRKAK